MICGTTCIIALVFWLQIYIQYCLVQMIKKIKRILNVLSAEQNTYEKLINERKTIYYMGYGFGILLAIIIIFIMKKY